MALGDVDGDLILDVLVGATGADRIDENDDIVPDAGKAFLILGSPDLADMDIAAAELVIAGNEAGS